MTQLSRREFLRGFVALLTLATVGSTAKNIKLEKIMFHNQILNMAIENPLTKNAVAIACNKRLEKLTSSPPLLGDYFQEHLDYVSSNIESAVLLLALLSSPFLTENELNVNFSFSPKNPLPKDSQWVANVYKTFPRIFPQDNSWCTGNKNIVARCEGQADRNTHIF